MTKHWDTSCIDWERRIIAGESLIPFAPLFPDEGEAALNVFKALTLVDAVPIVDAKTGQMRHPTFGECFDEWVFDFVRIIFGAYDAKAAQRHINEFFLLISKKNGKSTIAAGIMITALIRNWRYSCELLILAPTIEVAKNAFDPARDIVYADPEISLLLHVQENIRQITHRVTKAVLKVIAADTETVGGTKAAFVLIDELWLFGKKANADAMLREATGGLVARPEGFVISLSTQSDTEPTGVFKAKLKHFRAIRDGKVKDPKRFGVLYEFPQSMIEDATKPFLNPDNWYITNPSIGKAVSRDWLIDKLAEAERSGPAALASHYAKHLNIEIGLRFAADGWAGAEFWERCADKALTSLEDVLNRSDVAVVGIDGGGLDDLLGAVVIGREKVTEDWLVWAHAWAHPIVLKRRPEIANELRELERLGELTFVATPGEDVEAVAQLVFRIDAMGLLAEQGVGVDAAGITEILNALEDEDRGISLERVVAVQQGWKLNAAIKTAERRAASTHAGTRLRHCGQRLMRWSVGNAKVVQVGSAISITKQQSGTAKIDALMAFFDAVWLMALNPQSTRSVYEDEDYEL